LGKKHYIALLVYDEKTLIDVAILRGWSEMQSSHFSVDAPKMPVNEPNQLYPVI